MRGFAHSLLPVAFLFFIFISAGVGCTGWDVDCEDPEGVFRIFLNDMDGEVLRKTSSSLRVAGEGALHPSWEEEIYLEVVSQDLVRLIYEREGEVVVETYEVRQRYEE